jgi:hypothetical protein
MTSGLGANDIEDNLENFARLSSFVSRLEWLKELYSSSSLAAPKFDEGGSSSSSSSFPILPRRSAAKAGQTSERRVPHAGPKPFFGLIWSDSAGFLGSFGFKLGSFFWTLMRFHWLFCGKIGFVS